MASKRGHLDSVRFATIGRVWRHGWRRALRAKWSLLVGSALSSACADDGDTNLPRDVGNMAGSAGTQAPGSGGSSAGTQAPGSGGSSAGTQAPGSGGSSAGFPANVSGGSGGANHGGAAGSGSSSGAAGKSGAGTGGQAGASGAAGGVAGTATAGTGGNLGGKCCASGDCLCHGPDPTGLTSSDGPFTTTTFTISTGTVHYPTDAEPPFAAVALCGGFLNTGPEMAPWGSFYASHGIVTIITTTTGADLPDLRATKLLASIEAIKAENARAGSPLNGKLAGRYGTSGYSMGGGGTTLASVTDPSLKSSVGLAPWTPVGENISVPTLLLCGASDGTAPCSMADGAYTAIPATTPKMMVTIAGTAHLDWFGPTDAGGGVSGETALAFQKVFLEGDERWRPFLLEARGTLVTNIQ